MEGPEEAEATYLGPPDPSRGATPPPSEGLGDLAGFLSARATFC